MSSALYDYIMSKKNGAGANVAELQQIGRDAARAYIDNGVELNTSLRGMAKEASLNFEQIKRVAEYANNEAFLMRFRQPYKNNVEFPVADATVIASGMHLDVTPVVEKTASSAVLPTNKRYLPGQEDRRLAHLFDVPKEKVASTGPTRDELIRKYLATKDEYAIQKQEQMLQETDFLSKMAHLNRVVYQEMQGGTRPWEIGAAVVAANPSNKLFTIVAGELGHYMETSGISKMAALGMEVEEGNPVTSLVEDLENVVQKLLANEELTQRTKGTIEELLALLRGPADTNPTADLFAEKPPDPTAPPPMMAAAMPPGPMGQPAPMGAPPQM